MTDIPQKDIDRNPLKAFLSFVEDSSLQREDENDLDTIKRLAGEQYHIHPGYVAAVLKHHGVTLSNYGDIIKTPHTVERIRAYVEQPVETPASASPVTYNTTTVTGDHATVQTAGRDVSGTQQVTINYQEILERLHDAIDAADDIPEDEKDTLLGRVSRLMRNPYIIKLGSTMWTIAAKVVEKKLLEG